MTIPADLAARAGAVELISFDVDGVLTDGAIVYTDDGRELKAFNVQDGAAIKLLMSLGVEVALLTGRTSPMVERRAAELGVTHLYQGLEDKGPALAELCGRLGLSPAQTAHVGDDLPDLALFDLVGFAVAVPNGHPAVIERAHHVTDARGGEGVARELAQLILTARNVWPY